MTKMQITLMTTGVLFLFAGSIAAGYLVGKNQKNPQLQTDQTQEKPSGNIGQQNNPPPLTSEKSEDSPFTVEEGLRMEYATNPGAKMVGDDVQLLFEDANTRKQVIAQADQSSDWLDYTRLSDNADANTFRAHQLPDGTWRAYGINSTVGIDGTCLKSQSSTDGSTFTEDEGCRYELHENDKGRMGVYDFLNTSDGNVVMLYIGDLTGLNNVRRAISTDNGWTFTYDQGNVLGDDNAGGGSRSYVDEKVIRLTENSFYLVAMKQGVVYGFLSTDDGATFEPQGQILSAADFGIETGSLHDPQIMQLPDGRYRIFVTLFDQETEKSSIVSAVAKEITD